jgi:hypothetical protein
MAFVIAIGVKNTGEREVLGFDLGTSEDGAFWLAFCGVWSPGDCAALNGPLVTRMKGFGQP